MHEFNAQCFIRHLFISRTTLTSSLPILDLFMVFSRRYLIDGNGEQGRAGGLTDLAAQAAGQGIELGCGQLTHFPLADGRLDLAEQVPDVSALALAVGRVTIRRDNEQTFLHHHRD